MNIAFIVAEEINLLCNTNYQEASQEEINRYGNSI